MEMITRDFSEDQKELVIKELSSIESKHVMAESDYNLENTRLSILKRAHGNVQQVIHFTQKAKIDFRDVIMRAMQEE